MMNHFRYALCLAALFAGLSVALSPSPLAAGARAQGVKAAGGAKRPLNIAHRGASGSAPEHTLAAYQLAIEQGADFVEQDLQITRDGHLVCMHDPEMSRTTNVAEVFPGRATLRDADGDGEPSRGYYVVDFSLAEIQKLDAGSWFNRANPFAARPAYAGQRVPTLVEALRAIGDRAGLYIEMKYAPFYQSAGFNMPAMLAEVLDREGYGGARSRRVFIQSFHKSSLLRFEEVAPQYPRVQLLPMEDKGRREATRRITAELAREIATYAQGAGPSKSMISGKADVDLLHAAGLVVHPYTFRGPTTPVNRQPLDTRLADGRTIRQAIAADITRFIDYGIDGGFTDYPSLWAETLEKKPASGMQ